MAKIPEGAVCVWCGTKDNLTRDHIIPKWLSVRLHYFGIKNFSKKNNIQILCNKCNNAHKGGRLDFQDKTVRETMREVKNFINRNLREHNYMKIVAVSGGFDPFHTGHLEMFREAKKLGDFLVVFLNSDEFLERKKGKSFMNINDRKLLLEAVKYVDKVVPVIDKDDSVCETLKEHKPHIFANGGDRTKDNVPEVDVCKELDIKMVWGVGGGKTRSSSELLDDYSNKK